MLKHFALLAALTLAACGQPDIKEFSKADAKLDVREYFNGRINAFGTITDYKGAITDRVFVEMNGTWNGNKGKLEEHFRYGDGTTEDRTWQLEVSDDGTKLRGTREDTVGEMTGEQSGNAVFMKYTINRKVDGESMELTVDDRLYLVENPYVINEIRLKKYGVTVSTINLGFHRLNEF